MSTADAIRERRARLWSGGIFSSDLDVISLPEIRRRRLEQDAIREKKIQRLERNYRRLLYIQAISKAVVHSRPQAPLPPGEEPLIDGPEAPRHLNVRTIAIACSQHFQMTVAELMSHQRLPPLVRVRQICMYLSREHTRRSTPEIGRLMNGRDHTTIIHGHRRIAGLLATDEKMQADVAAVRELLGLV